MSSRVRAYVPLVDVRLERELASLLRLRATRSAKELSDDLGSIPPFNEDDEGDRTPQSVLDLRHRIGEADALLISTPEYNHSVPGVIKNAMDWASRPAGRSEIVGKPAAVMSASLSTFGGVWAQAELRKSLAAAGARVHDEGVALSKASERVDAEGNLVDQEFIDQIVGLVEESCTASRRRTTTSVIGTHSARSPRCVPRSGRAGPAARKGRRSRRRGRHCEPAYSTRFGPVGVGSMRGQGMLRRQGPPLRTGWRSPSASGCFGGLRLDLVDACIEACGLCLQGRKVPFGVVPSLLAFRAAEHAASHEQHHQPHHDWTGEGGDRQ